MKYFFVIFVALTLAHAKSIPHSTCNVECTKPYMDIIQKIVTSIPNDQIEQIKQSLKNAPLPEGVTLESIFSSSESSNDSSSSSNGEFSSSQTHGDSSTSGSSSKSFQMSSAAQQSIPKLTQSMKSFISLPSIDIGEIKSAVGSLPAQNGKIDLNALISVLPADMRPFLEQVSETTGVNGRIDVGVTDKIFEGSNGSPISLASGIFSGLDNIPNPGELVSLFSSITKNAGGDSDISKNLLAGFKLGGNIPQQFLSGEGKI